MVAAFGAAMLALNARVSRHAAVDARFPRYPRLFAGRQVVRTLHFRGLCAFAVFVVGHTAMVVLHGLGNELTYMALASDPAHASATTALIVGIAGIVAVIAINVLATVVSLRHRRGVQRVTGKLVDPFERAISRTFTSRQHFTPTDISAYHRVNGYPPPDHEYRRLVRDRFADYRLEVSNLVERPLALSLRELGETSQITMHHCIQGWTNVAEWGGVPVQTLLERCRPASEARYLVCYAFDDKTITENEGRFGLFYGMLGLEPRVIRRPSSRST